MLYLVIVISITMVLGTSILSISMVNFQISKFSSNGKQTFYLAEDGINKSYLASSNLILDAIQNSKVITQEYLEIYPTNTVEANSIFDLNYKSQILSNINKVLPSESNPKIEITNLSSLNFIAGKLMVKIKSTYESQEGITKIVLADFVIIAPKYSDVNNSITISNYIIINNWKIDTRSA